MKKIISLFLLFIFTILLYSENFKTYNLELIKTFPNGMNKGELGYNYHPSPSMPYGVTTITCDKIGNFYIGDTYNKRFVILDNNLKLNNIISLNYPIIFKKIEVDDNNNIIAYNLKSIRKINKDGKFIFFLDFRNKLFNNKIQSLKTIVFNDFVLLTDKTKGEIIINNPSLDNKKNIDNIISKKEEIKNRLDKLIKNKNSNYIIKDFNKHYKSFNKQKSQNNIGIQIHNLDLNKIDPDYIAKDQFNNTYWIIYPNKMIVLNNNGILIDAFIIEEGNHNANYPAIDPEGNVYIMKFDKNNHYLYQYQRENTTIKRVSTEETIIENDYKKYYTEKYTILDSLEKDENIGINFISGSNIHGATSFSFDKDGNMYVYDTVNNKFNIYDKDKKYIKKIQYKEQLGKTKIEIDENGNIISYTKNLITKINNKGNNLFKIDLNDKTIENKNLNGLKSIVINNIVILQDVNNNYYAIENPGNNTRSNSIKLISSNEISNLLNKRNTNGLSYSENKIFRNNKLLTKNFKTYYTYKKQNLRTSEKDIPIKNLDLSTINPLFIGEDFNNNTFWLNEENKMLVLNNKGTLIDAFILPVSVNSPGRIAIHPDGNVMMLTNDKFLHFVLIIKRK